MMITVDHVILKVIILTDSERYYFYSIIGENKYDPKDM